MKKYVRVGVTAVVLTGMGLSTPAFAASDSWNINTDGNWNSNASWLSGTQTPGSTSGITSTDIATFGLTLTADRVVTVDANRNIGGITFSGNNTDFKYTLSGGNLLLTNGGVIQVNGTATSGIHTDTITSAITIQGDGGTGTFTSSGANDGSTKIRALSIGAVTGVSTTGNVTTMTLNGSSFGNGTLLTNNPNNFVTGIISDGVGGGKLALTKSGGGAWTLSVDNTYTGGTTVTAGVLRAQGTTANKILALGTGDLTLSGGALQLRAAAGGGPVITGSGLAGGGNNVVVTGNADIHVSGVTSGNTIQFQNLSIGANTLQVDGATQATLQFAGTTTLGGNAIFKADTSSLTLSGVVSDGGSNYGITKNGANGTVTLSNANTYGGVTTIGQGALITSLLADGGVASGIGKSSNAAGNLLIGGSGGSFQPLAYTSGALRYTGAATSTDRLFTINGTANGNGATLDASGTGAVKFTNTGHLGYGTVDQTRVLSLTGTNTGANTLSAIIEDNGTGATSLIKFSTGSWTLTNTNTYTGTTAIQGGILSVNSLKNLGTASSLGAPTTTANGLITIGATSTTGQLTYTGTGDTTNRAIQIGTNSAAPVVGDTGGATIQNDGSGALIFSSANFNTQTNATAGVGANRVLTLQGSDAHANEIQGVIQDNLKSGTATGTTAVALTKAGVGSWTLSGANSYTGNTTLSGGSLTGTQTSGTPFGTGAVSLTNSKLALAPTGSGANVSLTGSTATSGAAFTYNVGSTLSLDKGTNSSLTYTQGGVGSTFTRGTNGTLILSVSAIANLGNTVAGGGERFLMPGTVTLVNNLASAVVAQDRGNSNAGDFVTYGATNGFAAATPDITNDFTGSTNTKYVSISSGTTNGANSAVYALKVSGATVTNTGRTITLGGAVAGVAGLILNGGTISSGTLTTAAAASTELDIYTSGTSAISSSINTAANQNGVTVFGPGSLDLSGSSGNSFTNNLRVNQSTVIVTNDNQLGVNTGQVTLTGATLQTSGTVALGTTGQRTISLVAGGGNSGGTFNVTGGTTTFTSGVGKVISGTGSLTKTGLGTLVLAGSTANTYTGATLVNGGTLLVNGILAAGSAVTVASSGTLGGSGTINGATTIQSGGSLSPGNSPGVLTTGALTFDSGSDFKFELNANSLTTRGTNFDGVNILTGAVLSIASGAVSDLTFNGVGSAVDWSNSFWGSSQSWLVLDTADNNYSGSLFTLGTVSVDSLSQSLASVRAGSSFSYGISGGDIYLNYTAVPEPSTYALVGAGLISLWALRRKKKI